MLELHITLALVSVSGFVLRVGWALTDAPQLQQKFVRIAPHVIDTLLLLTGILMALELADGFANAWLIAKLVALFGYIGFGVLALRGQGPGKWVGIVGALICVAYIFWVAFNKAAIPF